MITNFEIKILANEIMDLIIFTSTDDVCIDCQKEMIGDLLEEKLLNRNNENN